MAERPPVALDAEEAARRLEVSFLKVHAERMHDVPILNKALRVEVVGPREAEQGWLAALVTPWSINLMLLPKSPTDADAWRTLGAGSTATHTFPAGRFSFIAGEEVGLGAYQMCSLFSPVLEFESQEAAVLAAGAAVDALFDAGLAPDDDRRQGAPKEPLTPTAPSAEAPRAAGLTRRGLLLGSRRATGMRNQ